MRAALLAAGANPNSSSWRSNPLVEACAVVDNTVVRMLLAAGADPNLPSRRSGSALSQALGHRDAALIALLKSSGALR